MLGTFFRGCLLALLACPLAALAQPVHSRSFLPAGVDAPGMHAAGQEPGESATGADMPGLHRALEDADGWTIVEAYDSHDARQILGKACRGDECLPVRLDPVSAVPEPGSYALLAAGLVLLAGWRRSGGRDSLRFS